MVPRQCTDFRSRRCARPSAGRRVRRRRSCRWLRPRFRSYVRCFQARRHANCRIFSTPFGTGTNERGMSRWGETADPSSAKRRPLSGWQSAEWANCGNGVKKPPEDARGRPRPPGYRLKPLVSASLQAPPASFDPCFFRVLPYLSCHFSRVCRGLRAKTHLKAPSSPLGTGVWEPN